jgi:hypothetical protein
VIGPETPFYGQSPASDWGMRAAPFKTFGKPG